MKRYICVITSLIICCCLFLSSSLSVSALSTSKVIVSSYKAGFSVSYECPSDGVLAVAYSSRGAATFSDADSWNCIPTAFIGNNVSQTMYFYWRTVSAGDIVPVTLTHGMNFGSALLFLPGVEACAMAYSETHSEPTAALYEPADLSEASYIALSSCINSSKQTIHPSGKAPTPLVNFERLGVILFEDTSSVSVSVQESYSAFCLIQLTEPEPVVTSPPDNSGAQLEVSNSILDNIKNMFSKIAELVDLVFNLPKAIQDVLAYLFIPPEDFVIDIFQEYIDEKFPIVGQIGDIVSSMFDFTPYSAAPVFTFVWHDTEVPIVDFTPFSGVISIFWPIILAFSWGKFVLWLLDYIPGLLGGVKY